METPDSNAWVFDSLIGFLHGPVWNVPLQTFIEEKSLPFEPSDTGNVLDRPEYKQIHNEYRNLVDVMLGSFMDDIGISADQFEAACRLSAHDLAGLPSYFHKRLFEQIWAANDYDMFIKMMTHKNVELQLQALELIERRNGAMPNIFSSSSEDLDTSQSEEEHEYYDNDDVMTEIKKLQLQEFETSDEIVTVPPEDVVAEKQTLLSKLKNTKLQKAGEITQENTEAETITDVKKSLAELTYKEPAKAACNKIKVSEDEVRTRQEYLKQQRDKLLSLKKQVREKRLGTAEVTSEFGGFKATTQERPRSAKVAQAALAGITPHSPPDALQLRRALATKLKAEVVDTCH